MSVVRRAMEINKSEKGIDSAVLHKVIREDLTWYIIFKQRLKRR